jgi:phosphoribosylformylglycinamidine (FGAM) synthase PurS component
MYVIIIIALDSDVADPSGRAVVRGTSAATW